MKSLHVILQTQDEKFVVRKLLVKSYLSQKRDTEFCYDDYVYEDMKFDSLDAIKDFITKVQTGKDERKAKKKLRFVKFLWF